MAPVPQERALPILSQKAFAEFRFGGVRFGQCEEFVSALVAPAVGADQLAVVVAEIQI